MALGRVSNRNSREMTCVSGGERRSSFATGHRVCFNDFMHNVIAFSSVPLFIGALLSDWAYASSYEIQWTNFASWLLAGGLLLAGLALLWAVVDLLRSHTARHRRGFIYLLLLLATFALGFVDALVHAKDGWAAMPTGLILSAAVVALAAAASAVGLVGWHRRAP